MAYGSKAANGVILITKRGKQGPRSITTLFWWSSFGIDAAYQFGRISSVDYEAENWGAISEGATPEQATKRMPYSQTDIDLYANGTDPYGHPNTDWNKLFFVGSGFTNRHNVSVGGGVPNG